MEGQFFDRKVNEIPGGDGMDQQILFRKIMALAKMGEVEAFENFYILTVGDTYAKIRNAVKDKRNAEQILADTYARLYKHVRELPVEEDKLDERIDHVISRIIYKKLGMEIEEFYTDRNYPSLSEDRAATILLWVEDRAGIVREKPQMKKSAGLSDFLNAAKIMTAVLMLCVTAFVAYKGWDLFIRKDQEAISAATEAETTEAYTMEETFAIEEEELIPGWELRTDGTLYYVTKEKKLADHALPLGKQVLSFSPNGALTLISSNPDISEEPNLSFDENMRYEVRDGDVYVKDIKAGGPETAVTQNGHVVQADVRAGYLWYICQYQVPNSKQVKTVVYRSKLDGESQVEIYTTDNTLNMEQFQITEDWMYYISDGMLLRRSLETNKVELMAQNVENYFAWGNTAYYMRDRVLEKISEGVDYSGIEAGYRIELRNGGFVLLDMVGEPVKPDENGKKQVGDRIYSIPNELIKSVSPAPRESGGTVYFIESAGSDRKIYSRNSSGAQSLIRQDGIQADSICVAGEWLYYSARIEIYGTETASQIFRLNLETLESEEVGNGFEGYMKNMYFFEDLQSIFAEYVPSTENPASQQGKIAYIPIGGDAKTLEDSGALPAGDSAYMLELITADSSQVSCLYHTYTYDEATETMEWTSSVPVEIQYK